MICSTSRIIEEGNRETSTSVSTTKFQENGECKSFTGDRSRHKAVYWKRADAQHLITRYNQQDIYSFFFAKFLTVKLLSVKKFSRWYYAYHIL